FPGVAEIVDEHPPKRGRLRERAKSYAKALANDILR
ncbi:LysR family transcriptional regulator, partial [Enterobacter cloacae]